MPALKQYGIDAQIRGEIVKALGFFDAKPATLAAFEIAEFFQPVLYETFVRLGARSDLLGIIGSWGDTMDDEWVLNALREWNRRVRPIPGRGSSH